MTCSIMGCDAPSVIRPTVKSLGDPFSENPDDFQAVDEDTGLCLAHWQVKQAQDAEDRAYAELLDPMPEQRMHDIP